MGEKAVASMTQLKNPFPPEHASLYYLKLGELHLYQRNYYASIKYLKEARTIMQVFL
jgi:hypothetical protein